MHLVSLCSATVKKIEMRRCDWLLQSLFQIARHATPCHAGKGKRNGFWAYCELADRDERFRRAWMTSDPDTRKHN